MKRLEIDLWILHNNISTLLLGYLEREHSLKIILELGEILRSADKKAFPAYLITVGEKLYNLKQQVEKSEPQNETLIRLEVLFIAENVVFHSY